MRGDAARLDQRSLREPDFRQAGAAGRLVRDAAAALRSGRRCDRARRRPWNEEAARSTSAGAFESKLTLVKAQDLEQRLSQDAPAPSHGLVFAQTDDETRVAKAVRTYVPRLGRSRAPTSTHRRTAGSQSTTSSAAAIRAAAPARAGALVPHGRCRADARRGGGSGRALRPLRQGLDRRRVLLAPRVPRTAAAPGDVVALNANPTVAHRLTGADPERVRARWHDCVLGRPASAEDLYRSSPTCSGVPRP